jgi:hypothetical protein
MAGWLSRTKSLFQQPLPAPEPFDVECDCGGKLVGVRTGAYQKPACPVCDRPVFVLPSNVYPRPKPKSSPKTDSPKSSGEIKTVRSPSTLVVDDHPRGIRSTGGADVKSRGGRPGVPQPVVEQPELKEPRRRIFTPLRMVTLAIIGITGLTAHALWYQQAYRAAQATVAVATDDGKAAIRELDFVKGAKELEKARRAVDLLGRKDSSADEIRRLSREATVLANLASSSLTDILQETLSSAKPDQTESMAISSLYKNAWILFDSPVIPESSSSRRLIIDAPIVLGIVPVQVEVESKALTAAATILAADAGGELARIIFAAQVEEIVYNAGKPGSSVVKLNGNTAILWTSYDTYQAIGYRPIDDDDERQTKAILQRQLEMR